MVNNITVVIPSHNTLNHLKNTYESIRKYYPDMPLVIIDDASTDDTAKWLLSLNDRTVTSVIDDVRRGHTYWYDEGIKMSNTDLVAILHSDMMIGPNYFENLVKHLVLGTVVCATRVEPPIHPEGKEKFVRNFGMDYYDFNAKAFEEFCLEIQKTSGQTTRGVFAPWILYKTDYLAIGGHDQNFAPYGYEDSDIFNRWILAGYKMVQSRDALVYHLTCRGHRWNAGVGIENADYKETMARGQKYFIRKWNQWIENDEFMHPIIYPKFDTRLIIHNLQDINLLRKFEPWFGVVQCDNKQLVDAYIAEEQIRTKIDMSTRVIYSNQPIDLTLHDVNVILDNTTIVHEDIIMLGVMNKIIANTGESGTYELGNIQVHINKLDNTVHTLIHA